MEPAEALGWGWTMSDASTDSAKRSPIRRLFRIGAWSLAAGCLAFFLGFLAFVYTLDRFE